MRARRIVTKLTPPWALLITATLLVFSVTSVLADSTNAVGTTGTIQSRLNHGEVDFSAGAKELYEALLDSAEFSAFSGRPAEINGEVGGTACLFGGQIVAQSGTGAQPKDRSSLASRDLARRRLLDCEI